MIGGTRIRIVGARRSAPRWTAAAAEIPTDATASPGRVLPQHLRVTMGPRPPRRSFAGPPLAPPVPHLVPVHRHRGQVRRLGRSTGRIQLGQLPANLFPLSPELAAPAVGHRLGHYWSPIAYRPRHGNGLRRRLGFCEVLGTEVRDVLLVRGQPSTYLRFGAPFMHNP